MALLDVSKVAFSSGELSTRMFARQDVDRYKNGATELENWVVLPQGGVARRAGTRYVATVKTVGKLTLLRPFEPSTTDAYVLEMGEQYLRFYKNTARIESPPGTPVEVPTPYTEAQLRLVRTAQSNDVMILVHGSHAPRRLSRLSDTSWVFATVPFYPPPVHEFGYSGGTTATLSATSGSITITGAAAVFLPGDVQRTFTAGVGRAIITGYVSNLVVNAQVLETFTATAWTAGTWTLGRTTVAELSVDKTGPLGANVTLTLGVLQPDTTELVDNGGFSTLADWTNLSAPELASGAHDGGDNSPTLIDNGQDFLAAGVRAGHVVHNVTDGSFGTAANVGTEFIVLADPGLFGGAESDFDNTDSYTVTATGGAQASGGMAILTGGAAGYGWIEQGIGTTSGLSYSVTFTVGLGAMAFLVGSVSGQSDVLAEASYPPGTHRVQFTATGATSYLGFRNNQPGDASVGQVSAKIYTVDGFRSVDVGSYVRIHDGLIRLHTYTNGHSMQGEIVRELDTDDPAAPGAWSIAAPAWSDTLGWPSTVVLYEGRLYLAGSARFPQTIWGSAIDDFFNFALGVNPDDAVQFDLVDSGGNITLNLIRWLMPAENMLVGTTHGEYRLIGAGDDPLSPTSPPRTRIQSTFGSDTVQPLKVGAALLFPQRQGSKLREMAYDERTQTTFVARDITITSDHLLRALRILEMAYQQEPLGIVYAVRSDGQLLGLTYDQTEQIAAWWRCVTSGTIESVAVIPDSTENRHQIWVTVARTINGNATRFVEIFDPSAPMTFPTPIAMHNDLTQDDVTQTGWTGLTVDAGKVYTGLNTNTLTGLTHLNGATVQLVINGAVWPEQVVTSNQLVLAQTVQGTAFVGLGFTARGRTLPAEPPSPGGSTAQLLRKRWVKLRARVDATANLVLHGERVPFRRALMPMDQGVGLYTGDVDVLPLGWSGLGLITFLADQPLPSTVLGIYGVLDTETR